METAYLIQVAELVARVARAVGASVDDAEFYVSRIEGSTRLESRMRSKAKEAFQLAVQDKTEIQETANRFLVAFSKKPHTITACLDSLLRVFSFDAAIFERVESEIKTISQTFRFPSREYGKLRAWNLGTEYVEEEVLEKKPSKHALLYQQLGCPDRASLSEVRRSYRQLAKLYHPDRMSALGIQDDVTKDLNRRFQEINDAYEKLRKELSAS